MSMSGDKVYWNREKRLVGILGVRKNLRKAIGPEKNELWPLRFYKVRSALNRPTPGEIPWAYQAHGENWANNTFLDYQYLC